MNLQQVLQEYDLQPGKVTVYQYRGGSKNIGISMTRTGYLSGAIIHVDPLFKGETVSMTKNSVHVNRTNPINIENAVNGVMEFMMRQRNLISEEDAEDLVLQRLHDVEMPQEYASFVQELKEPVPNRIDAQFVAEYLNDITAVEGFMADGLGNVYFNTRDLDPSKLLEDLLFLQIKLKESYTKIYPRNVSIKHFTHEFIIRNG